MPPVKNSDTTASSARTLSAACRPSTRELRFCSRIAWATAGFTSVPASAAFSCESERNGAPSSSLTCACDTTDAGTSGLFWIPARNEPVSEAIRIEPASAVPSEASRLVDVFCSPPTSPLSESGTDDTTSAPSCDARVPIPSPISTRGMATTAADASRLMPDRRTRIPTSISRIPTLTARRKRHTAGKRRGTPSAPIRSARESGRIRSPVSSAGSSRTTDRKSGTTKKTPALDQELEPEHREPRAQHRDLQHRGLHERFAAAVDDGRLPQEEAPQQEQSSDDEPERERRPEQ